MNVSLAGWAPCHACSWAQLPGKPHQQKEAIGIESWAPPGARWLTERSGSAPPHSPAGGPQSPGLARGRTGAHRQPLRLTTSKPTSAITWSLTYITSTEDVACVSVTHSRALCGAVQVCQAIMSHPLRLAGAWPGGSAARTAAWPLAAAQRHWRVRLQHRPAAATGTAAPAPPCPCHRCPTPITIFRQGLHHCTSLLVQHTG